MAQFPFTEHKRPPFWQKSKTNCKTLDYISSLPDCILHYILSFLDIEDAIKTSVLSKRWLSVWAAVPVLNFCHSNCKHADEFASFVDKTLRFYSGPNLEKLLINFRYSNSLSSQADEWMDFAMRHNVEELCLDFGGETIEYHHDHVYRMTQSMYSNSSLRKLNTVLCYFKPSGCVSWTSLKVLSIGYAEVNNDIIFKILLGSPILEFLKLQHCKGDNQIIVSSSSLKELVIDGFWGSTGSVMEISGPNIRLLRLCGYTHRRKFMLINVSALVEADVSFVMQTDVTDENVDYRIQCNLVQDLLGNLSHVPKLTIGTWCLQVLSVCELQGLVSPLPNCTSLTLDSKINKWDIPGIANLLETSPDLEELIINLLPLDNSEIEFCAVFEEDTGDNGGIAYKFDGGKYLKSKCLSLQIRIIEITGYGPRLAGFEFFSSLVEVLLESARMLEKMVIYAQSDILSGSWLSVGIEQEQRDLLEASQFFSSWPRASRKAAVILKCSIN